MRDLVNLVTDISHQYKESTENMSATAEVQFATFKKFNSTTTSIKVMMEELVKLVKELTSNK